MTDYTDLIARLRAWSHDERLGDGMLLRKSADALEAQGRRLAEAEARADRDVIERNRVIAEKSARLAEKEHWDDARVKVIHELHERANNAEARLASTQEQLRLCNIDQCNAEARLAEAEALLQEAREKWLQERTWVGGTENGRWQPAGKALMAFIRKIDAFLSPNSASHRENERE